MEQNPAGEDRSEAGRVPGRQRKRAAIGSGIVLLTLAVAWILSALRCDACAVGLLLPVALAAYHFGFAGLGAGVGLAALLMVVTRSASGFPSPPVALLTGIAAAVGGTGVVLLQGTRRQAAAESALLRAREQELSVLRGRLGALRSTAGAINSTAGLEDLVRGALERALDALDVRVGAIHLLNETTGELNLAAHRGLSEEFVRLTADLKVGDGFSGRVVLTGSPIIIDDAQSDPRLARMVAEKEDLCSFASLPIRNREQVLGALSIASYGTRAISQADVDVVTAIAGQLGVAVANARLFHEVQHLATELQESLAREKALQEQSAQQTHADGTLDAVRSVQDQINHPLMVIIANAELLDQRGVPLPPEVRRTLDQIVRAAHRVADFNEMLGRIPVPPRPLPVAPPQDGETTTKE